MGILDNNTANAPSVVYQGSDPLQELLFTNDFVLLASQISLCNRIYMCCGLRKYSCDRQVNLDFLQHRTLPAISR